MLANERDQMNDDEVLGQIGTLMLAGNETSATALSWATWHFVQRKDIQDKLREELLAVDEDPDA
jgi:cytochrome P450